MVEVIAASLEALEAEEEPVQEGSKMISSLAELIESVKEMQAREFDTEGFLKCLGLLE